jgi:hypothetical protein
VEDNPIVPCYGRVMFIFGASARAKSSPFIFSVVLSFGVVRLADTVTFHGAW